MGIMFSISTICSGDSNKVQDLHGWTDWVDVFIRVAEQRNILHVVSIGDVVGPAHWVRENAAAGSIDSIWLVNTQVDVNTYWTVCQLDDDVWFKGIVVGYVSPIVLFVN